MTAAARLRRGIGADGLRFLLAGAANALLTFALYQALLFALPPAPAYALTWLAGLGFVVVFYPSQVFRGGRTDNAARLRLALVYVAVFLIGLGCLKGLDMLGVAPRLAIVFVMAATTLANFLLGRFVLKPKAAFGPRG